MSSDRTRDVLGFTLAGVVGIAIGAGSMYFAQKSADVAENQYFMELDLLRLQTVVDEQRPFEEKLEYLEQLQTAHSRGFRPVFESNLENDIATTRAAIRRIAEAEKKSRAEAAVAREAEARRAAEAAQEQKERAVRTNPRIFEECLTTPGMLCP